MDKRVEELVKHSELCMRGGLLVGEDLTEDDGYYFLTDKARNRFVEQILFNNNLYLKVKCPHCEWSQFEGGETVGMTPCYNCDSTGYIYMPLEEME